MPIPLQYTCYFIFVGKDNLGGSSTIKTHLAQVISGDILNLCGSILCSRGLKIVYHV